ncbi:MAG TPA: hypothetical protein VKA23_05610 [Mariprofundaceae bacterium]|nr:hypothetical protein [Mariprofundaceae bacterium]
MKLMRGSRGRLSITFMLVFAVQVLVSSLCISTSAQAMGTIAPEHCHQNMASFDMGHGIMQQTMSEMPMQPQSEQLPSSTCSHCDSPDEIALFVNDLDISSPHLILAFMVMETIAQQSGINLPDFIERAQAPPRSSSTLYTTTQRIRI